MSERVMVVMMVAVLGAIALLAASCADDAPTQVSLARECVREQVAVASGAATQQLVEVFDARGLRVEARLTIDEDGWDDAITTFTYDADGRLLRSQTSTAGALGGPFARDFVYDAAGRLEAMTVSGEVTDFWARSLDLQYSGTAREPSRVVIDTGYAHVVDTLSYDDAGRVTARLREESAATLGPAPILTRDTFAYDAAGRVSEVRSDRGADDSVDTIYRVERGGDGRITRAGQFDDSGAWIEGNVYDWAGARVIELRWESTLDGTEHYTFDYDGLGQVSRVAMSYDTGGASAHRYELRGGHVGATCVDGVGDALSAPLDRFYADPAARYLYAVPGLALP